MNFKIVRLLVLSMTVCAGFSAYAQKTVADVASPSGNIGLKVSADEESRLTYEVVAGGEQILDSSALGVIIGTTSLSQFQRSVECDEISIDEAFTLPHGKISGYTNRCNELTLDCRGQGGRNLTIIFRVYDNAVAVRYGVVNRKGSRLSGELTTFNFSDIKNSWAMTYRKDYSWYYEPRTWDALTDAEGYAFPMLLQTAGRYVLLTEADNRASMSASRLVRGNQNGQFMLEPYAQSNIIDDDFLSPWRLMIIGSLEEIVESAVLPGLCDATEMEDLTWIKPGRMSWNWGAEDADSNPTMEQVKAYIDLAAYYGWEYFMLDDGWEGRIDLSEACGYAQEKNVGVFVWAHQGRFSADTAKNIEWFREWSEAGVKGVKIDFFEDDSRDMLAKYEGILDAAAQCRLMVNFHGCIKPSGLERRWPHLMTSEAVLGGEMYMFNTTMTPASHGVNLALTRNVLGSMDYTPVKYGNRHGRAITNTTWAYQTALTVAFESSLLCVCDCPANLTGHIAEPLLRAIPTVWDEIKCLEARPDGFLTVARRKDNQWWLATITSEPRNVPVDMSFLPEGEDFAAYIYTEGVHRTDVAFEYRDRVSSSTRIDLELGANSGATVVVAPRGSMAAPIVLRREAEDYNTRGSRRADADCSGRYYIAELNNAKKNVTFDDIEVGQDGYYFLTLYYLDNADHSAYIQVNGGEKEYHMFKSPGNAIAGKDMAFKTVMVHLSAGRNVIAYGNDNGPAPALDRATVTSFGIPAESGIEAVPSADRWQPRWRLVDGGVEIELAEASTVNLLDFEGKLLNSRRCGSGTHFVGTDNRRPLILNLVCGSRSYSVKLIGNRSNI